MMGKTHYQKPDLDNLLKALLDAVFSEDQHIAEVWAQKRWAPSGRIMIADLDKLPWYHRFDAFIGKDVEDFIFQ